jgi:enterochelin esterase family protein
MKMRILLFALSTILLGQLGMAQTNEPADDWKPATSNQPGKQYPQVNSEGRVRARIVAPQAESVVLEFLGGAKYPLTKGDDNAWVGITRPQDEGFHYYQLMIDGAGVPDPGSHVFLWRWTIGAAVSKVPPKIRIFYALKNVPHGQFAGCPLLLKNEQLKPPLLYLHPARL